MRESSHYWVFYYLFWDIYFLVKRIWNSLIVAHLLGLMTLGACYFTSSLLLPPESGVSPAFTLVASLSAFVINFAISFFLLPRNSKS